ncbi:hypothetical protein F503_05919 [Ophiostoma piceae UAMH 11346]|uniref:Uncharacterized protein n=1 Tax=Ophiostoma piceae (strain UAMH 11346) TaxID=1262450 RepID=S3CBE1_OPHP1|nr:hypothetical protein F503_05919 [Ophiostoma piceae UAMH 11346]
MTQNQKQPYWKYSSQMVFELHPEPSLGNTVDEYDPRKLHTLLPEAVVHDADVTSHRARYKIQTDDGHAPGLTYFIIPSSDRGRQGQEYGRYTKFCEVLTQYSRLHSDRISTPGSTMVWAFANAHDENPVRIASELDLLKFAVSRNEDTLGCQIASLVHNNWAPVILFANADDVPRKEKYSPSSVSSSINAPAFPRANAFPFSSRVFPGPPWLVPVDHPTWDSESDGSDSSESVIAGPFELPAKPVEAQPELFELSAEPVMPPSKLDLPPLLPSTFSLFPAVPIKLPAMHDRDRGYQRQCCTHMPAFLLDTRVKYSSSPQRCPATLKTPLLGDVTSLFTL